MTMKVPVRLYWLRVLDRLKPRYGVGGHPTPRVSKGTPEMTRRIEEILRRRDHV
jgi:hypothetical protein